MQNKANIFIEAEKDFLRFYIECFENDPAHASSIKSGIEFLDSIDEVFVNNETSLEILCRINYFIGICFGEIDNDKRVKFIDLDRKLLKAFSNFIVEKYDGEGNNEIKKIADKIVNAATVCSNAPRDLLNN